MHLWETTRGQLVGAVHPEGKGDAYLQLHPDFRALENEMIAWAEANLAVPADDGQQQRLDIFVKEYDAPRQRLLREHGYEKTSW